MKTQTTIKLDQAKIREVTNSPRGMTGLRMNKLANQVVRYAKQNAPNDTGALRKSIRILDRSYSMRGGLSFTVGSDLDYSLAVHEGSPAMTIYPRQAKMLKFPGKRDGKILYRPSVQKKAQKGNPFLEKAFEMAMRSI